MELAFRENLKKMRGTKSKEKFSQELEMSRSNYSRIESGKSDPTIKTLEQIAKLTNSTLVVDLIPNEPTEPESEQVTLDLEMEEEIISTLQNPQNTAISIPPTRCGLRGQNECHLSMFVLGNIFTAFLAPSVDGNISIHDKK